MLSCPATNHPGFSLGEAKGVPRICPLVWGLPVPAIWHDIGSNRGKWLIVACGSAAEVGLKQKMPSRMDWAPCLKDEAPHVACSRAAQFGALHYHTFRNRLKDLRVSACHELIW